MLNYTVQADLAQSTVTLKYIATDGYNAESVAPVTLNIYYKPKDNPAVTFRTGTFVALSHSTFSISRSIITDDATITEYWYELPNGDPTPDWVDISNSSSSFVFNGTYPFFNSNLVEIVIFAKDEHDLVGQASVFIEPKSKTSLNYL